ncbi:hypothetical protein N7537_006004 [Penicillium hordei]|uniref:Uncharacterized protein n=1 Tax=Penicillium hordei TaxID=40994 RepID=A0AAD6E758_9EURO|nr:uncharacterized protein N7537_006004 [Penicillium hordei]KAJ5603048.1 hypothetical protein N7537_006004 [Penicillium hordei]
MTLTDFIRLSNDEKGNVLNQEAWGIERHQRKWDEYWYQRGELRPRLDGIEGSLKTPITRSCRVWCESRPAAISQDLQPF